jgi:hypothetical protein
MQRVPRIAQGPNIPKAVTMRWEASARFNFVFASRHSLIKVG